MYIIPCWYDCKTNHKTSMSQKFDQVLVSTNYPSREFLPHGPLPRYYSLRDGTRTVKAFEQRPIKSSRQSNLVLDSQCSRASTVWIKGKSSSLPNEQSYNFPDLIGFSWTGFGWQPNVPVEKSVILDDNDRMRIGPKPVQDDSSVGTVWSSKIVGFVLEF